MVLLDNADTAVGHDFLDELIMARRQRAAHADDDPDPLTVVATSRGDLAERVRLRGESAVTLTGAGYADYLARSQTHIGRWWYPVLLPDLTLDEVGNMVSALELPGGTRRVGHLRGAPVHRRSSRCHPDDARRHRRAPGQSADLLAILARPEPGVLAPGGRTVEESLLSRLTEGMHPEAVADLATCAAARSEEAALRLAAESGLLTGMRGEDSVIFAAELWRTGAPGRAAQMHPMLRRLLLRRLAKRDPGAAADWNERVPLAQDTLPGCPRRDRRAVYALALGAVEHVSRWFAHCAGAPRPGRVGAAAGFRHRGAQPAGLPAGARDPGPGPDAAGLSSGTCRSR